MLIYDSCIAELYLALNLTSISSEPFANSLPQLDHQYMPVNIGILTLQRGPVFSQFHGQQHRPFIS